MPARSIHPLIASAVVEIYSNLGPSATVKTVAEKMSRDYGNVAPSERKIQDILHDHRAQTATLDAIPRINPLGKDWPKDSDNVHYLAALDNLLWPKAWGNAGRYPWTEPKILAALELKGLFGFPDNLNQTIPGKGPWQLLYTADSDYGTLSQLPAPLVLIEEIAIRRVLAETVEQNYEPYFDDIYDEIRTKNSFYAEHDRLYGKNPDEPPFLHSPTFQSSPPIMFFHRHGLVDSSTLEFHRRARRVVNDMYEWGGMRWAHDDTFHGEPGNLNPEAPKETIQEEELKSLAKLKTASDEINLRASELLIEIDHAVPFSYVKEEESLSVPYLVTTFTDSIGDYALKMKQYIDHALSNSPLPNPDWQPKPDSNNYEYATRGVHTPAVK